MAKLEAEENEVSCLPKFRLILQYESLISLRHYCSSNMANPQIHYPSSLAKT